MRNYTRKGDAFSRIVQAGRGPLTVRRWLKHSTGREYFTRVSVRECAALRVRDVLAALKEVEGVRPSLAAVVLVYRPGEHTAELHLTGKLPALQLGELLLSFVASRVGRSGALRWWWQCPVCGGRALTLYASRWGQIGQRLTVSMVACRPCLGLVYPSQTEHRTPSGDGRVLRWGEPERWQRRNTGSLAGVRAAARFGRRMAGLSR